MNRRSRAKGIETYYLGRHVGKHNAAETHETDDPDETNEAALLAACRIPPSGPQMGVSLKPYVLFFDEYYADLYRMTEAERWMNSASRIVFMGT